MENDTGRPGEGAGFIEEEKTAAEAEPDVKNCEDSAKQESEGAAESESEDAAEVKNKDAVEAKSKDAAEAEKESIPQENSADETEKAEEEPRIISEPDKNGVRYYFINKKGKSRGTGSRANSVGGNGGGKNHLRNSLLILLGIFCVVIAIGVSCSHLEKSITDSIWGGDVQEETAAPDYPYIAILNVSGTIQESNSDYLGNASGYQHQWTLDKIDQLIADDNNYGLVFFVDSPGGGVYESDELYFKIKEYQEETERPVYSAMGSMAASGGYYISAPCDKIIANRNCWTGSIGVTIGTIYDISGLLEKYGIKTKTITSGENKAMGSSVEPMTAEQEAIFRSLVDEAYEQFVGIVAEGRGMSADEVKKIADGRIYTAKQALDIGLIDGIGTLDEACGDMVETYELWNCDIVTLEPGYSSGIFDTIFSKLGAIGAGRSGDVQALLSEVEKGNEFPVSYMCEALDNR